MKKWNELMRDEKDRVGVIAVSAGAILLVAILIIIAIVARNNKPTDIETLPDVTMATLVPAETIEQENPTEPMETEPVAEPETEPVALTEEVPAETEPKPEPKPENKPVTNNKPATNKPANKPVAKPPIAKPETPAKPPVVEQPAQKPPVVGPAKPPVIVEPPVAKPEPTTPPATEPPAKCPPHNWTTVNHPEEGHKQGLCVCKCGQKFTSADAWSAHIKAILAGENPEDAVLYHSGWYDDSEWIVDKPAWSETVCSDCGAKQ